MLRLVNPDSTDLNQDAPSQDAPLEDLSAHADQDISDLEEAQLYKRLDELLFRILQLDEILHERSAFDSEKAAHLREQIREAQQKLDRIYDRIKDQGANDVLRFPARPR